MDSREEIKQFVLRYEEKKGYLKVSKIIISSLAGK